MVIKDQWQLFANPEEGNNCQFCRKSGHFQKDCLKCKSWFEKNGDLNAHVYFESNLIEV